MHRPYLGISFFLAIALAFSLCIATVSSATEYQHIPQPSALTGNPDAGELVELTAIYDSSAKELTWTATFAPSAGGALPNGYWLAINNGPNPKGHAGELSLLFFDGSDSNNVIVTAYAYNGQNGFSSFYDGQTGIPLEQTPDRIVSSITDSSFLMEGSITDDAGTGNRTLHIKLDVSLITSHTPRYPDPVDPWYGIGFESFIGYWFHPLSWFSGDYCTANDSTDRCLDVFPGQSSEGFLHEISFEEHGWYDKANRPTNTTPYCVLEFSKARPSLKKIAPSLQLLADSKTVRSAWSNRAPEENLRECYSVEVGESFAFSAIGTDPDQDDLTVSYSGAPAGSVLSPSSGTTGPSPLEVNFDWTPTLDQGGESFFIQFAFEDHPEDPNASTQSARTTCAVPLCVPRNEPPVCGLEIADISGVEECSDGDKITVSLDASGSSDPEGEDLWYKWTTTCVDAEGNIEELTTIGPLGELVLTQPGLGNPVSCEVSVTVMDMFKQSDTCSVQVEAEGCELCVEDLCGECNGSNECLDCLGVPNGNAELDRCEVCDGDGQSCLDCEGTDISALLFELDGKTIEQQQVLRSALNFLGRKGTKKKGNKKYKNRVWSEAEELQSFAWVNIWSIPKVQVQCANAEFCVSISNVETLEAYNETSNSLANLTDKTIRRLRKQLKKATGRKKVRAGGKILKRSNALLEEALSLSSQVPGESSSCD